MDRRRFLKVAGLGALGLAGGLPATGLLGKEKERYLPSERGLTGGRWAIVVDLTKDVSDDAAIGACHRLHNVPRHTDKRHEIKWIWNTGFRHAFPGQDQEFLAESYRERPALVMCNHCDNPPCVQVCPTKATFKRTDGIVLMDFHRCIGCRFCMAACPYGARSFNWVDPRPAIDDINLLFPTRTTGVVEKCNLCVERLARGLIPGCVEASSEGRMTFGDLSDPKSEVREVLRSGYSIRRKQHLGTEPSVFYLV